MVGSSSEAGFFIGADLFFFNGIDFLIRIIDITDGMIGRN